MGNIFSRTTSHQLRPIKCIHCAAQKTNLIPKEKKIILWCFLCPRSSRCLQVCWSTGCRVGEGGVCLCCSKESGITEDFLVVSECVVKSSEKSNWLCANEKASFFPTLQRWRLNSSKPQRHQNERGQVWLHVNQCPCSPCLYAFKQHLALAG